MNTDHSNSFEILKTFTNRYNNYYYTILEGSYVVSHEQYLDHQMAQFIKLAVYTCGPSHMYSIIHGIVCVSYLQVIVHSNILCCMLYILCKHSCHSNYFICYLSL